MADYCRVFWDDFIAVQCSASTPQQYTVLHFTVLHNSTRNQCRLALFWTILHRSAVHSFLHSWVHLVHSCGADLWLRGNASINLQVRHLDIELHLTVQLGINTVHCFWAKLVKPASLHFSCNWDCPNQILDIGAYHLWDTTTTVTFASTTARDVHNCRNRRLLLFALWS